MTSGIDIGLQLLRCLPPEMAHRLTIGLLRSRLVPDPAQMPDDPILSVDLFGLRFPNPIGLAAGFDKNGEVVAPMLRFGFGAIEVGSVTPQPQAGNPKPRLFRLMEDAAVINRMGFNNRGHVYMARRLTLRRSRAGIVGVNLGANKDSSDRIADYVRGVQLFAPLADYLTINISSPNTPGLRSLQSGSALEELLRRLTAALSEQRQQIPLLLKIAPDLTEGEIETIVDTSLRHKLSGLIIGNTTLARPAGLQSRYAVEGGGLSGVPLMDISTKLLGVAYRISKGRLALIGVGGIVSGSDAYRKIRAGATLVQLYSALVFHGPLLVSQIKTDLAARLRADGFSSITDAVGADWR